MRLIWKSVLAPQVKGKAALAIWEMSGNLQPEITEYYKEVLPAVFYVLHDPTPDVQVRRPMSLRP